MAPWAMASMVCNLESRNQMTITTTQLERMNIGQLLALLADIEECINDLEDE